MSDRTLHGGCLEMIDAEYWLDYVGPFPPMPGPPPEMLDAVLAARAARAFAAARAARMAAVERQERRERREAARGVLREPEAVTQAGSVDHVLHDLVSIGLPASTLPAAVLIDRHCASGPLGERSRGPVAPHVLRRSLTDGPGAGFSSRPACRLPGATAPRARCRRQGNKATPSKSECTSTLGSVFGDSGEYVVSTWGPRGKKQAEHFAGFGQSAYPLGRV